MEVSENYWKQLKIPAGRPSLSSENHDLVKDVKQLKSALKFVTNRKKIIEILCSRTSNQRLEIAKAYKSCFDRDLLEVIKRKFNGDFRNLLTALLTPIDELFCQDLHDELNRAVTDEEALIQILVPLSNRDIQNVHKAYMKRYERSLEKDLKADTCGNFRKLLVALANGTRDESNVLDLYSARVDAVDLKKAGIERWGTDVSTFNRIFCLRNHNQLSLIAQEYECITGRSLLKDIKKEFGSDIKDSFIAILRHATNRPRFFARCLHNSMSGTRTDDKSLIRLVVTRSEIDIIDIKEEFEVKFGKSLKSFIKKGSGSYRKGLLKLIGE